MGEPRRQNNLPLPEFYSSTLTSLLPLFDDSLPSSSPSYLDTLSSGLDDLYLITRMISSLGLYSENEELEELGDRELGFMTLGWVLGEAEGRGGLGGPGDRKAALSRSEAAFNGFLDLLRSYGVLSPEEEAESSAMASSSGAIPTDPARKREAKIRQYKREKELRGRIAELAPTHPEPSSSPLLFILSLFPSLSSGHPNVLNTSTGASSTSTGVNDDPPDQRDLTLLILRLLHTLTLGSLGSITMELELLAEAPSASAPADARPSDTRMESSSEDDNTWRLDRAPGARPAPRELISGGGRVLRPFTILPSTTTMSDRERLRGEVFRQSHRLPTMTIDEYLEEERRRGNIISGGGPASQNAPTTSELLALAAENDGTIEGEEAEEKKRRKEEDWTTWTEANPRGAGNTLNRG